MSNAMQPKVFAIHAPQLNPRIKCKRKDKGNCFSTITDSAVKLAEWLRRETLAPQTLVKQTLLTLCKLEQFKQAASY